VTAPRLRTLMNPPDPWRNRRYRPPLRSRLNAAPSPGNRGLVSWSPRSPSASSLQHLAEGCARRSRRDPRGRLAGDRARTSQDEGSGASAQPQPSKPASVRVVPLQETAGTSSSHAREEARGCANRDGPDAGVSPAASATASAESSGSTSTDDAGSEEVASGPPKVKVTTDPALRLFSEEIDGSAKAKPRLRSPGREDQSGNTASRIQLPSRPDRGASRNRGPPAQGPRWRSSGRRVASALRRSREYG